MRTREEVGVDRSTTRGITEAMKGGSRITYGIGEVRRPVDVVSKHRAVRVGRVFYQAVFSLFFSLA